MRKTLVLAGLAVAAAYGGLSYHLHESNGSVKSGPVATAPSANTNPFYTSSVDSRSPTRFVDAPTSAEAQKSGATVVEPAAQDNFSQFRKLLEDTNGHVESFFIQNNALATNRVDVLTSNEDYNALVRSLQRETNPESAARRIAYQSQFADQPLVRDGSVSLNDVACGQTLCTASITASDSKKANQYFADIMQQQGSQPIYATVNVFVPGQGNTEERILFSSDSSVHGVIVPINSSSPGG